MSEVEKKPTKPAAAPKSKGTLVVALHKINGIIEPGTAFFVAKDLLAELKALDAVRDPTDVEVTLFEKAAGTRTLGDESVDDIDAALG